MQSHLISRRSLIRSSLIGLACSAAPAISAAEKDDWTETYDVVIIGSGFAGLAAAYSALENGVKSVLVLEKMNVFGGNSCINGGQISLAGSGLQKSKGIKDSPKLMEEDMLRVGQRSEPSGPGQGRCERVSGLLRHDGEMRRQICRSSHPSRRPQRSENHLCRKLRRRRYLRSYAQVAEGSRR